MAKFTETEKKLKVEYARQLYCKGFDYDVVADMLGGVSASTVRSWAVEYDFERSKRSQLMALSAIRDSVLESYADILDGKKPKITPDQAAKYATAFEKFSDKKKVLMFMYEAYELLEEQVMRQIQAAPERKDKEDILTHLKFMRGEMKTVVNNLNQEVLGNG